MQSAAAAGRVKAAARLEAIVSAASSMSIGSIVASGSAWKSYVSSSLVSSERKNGVYWPFVRIDIPRSKIHKAPQHAPMAIFKRRFRYMKVFCDSGLLLSPITQKDVPPHTVCTLCPRCRIHMRHSSSLSLFCSIFRLVSCVNSHRVVVSTFVAHAPSCRVQTSRRARCAILSRDAFSLSPGVSLAIFHLPK